MAEPMTQAQSFTLFPLLPLELRRRIWEFCLPVRVIELDHLWIDESDPGHDTHCNMGNATAINLRTPIITRVCSESRSVALRRTGRLLLSDPPDDTVNPRVQSFVTKWLCYVALSYHEA